MTEMAVDQQSHVKVDIYIAEHCPVCTYAIEVASMIRHEFPTVDVQLIRLDEPNIVIPDSVFATPTYLLNGQRWSLGNPSPETVRKVLVHSLRL
jgi:hypothetical protein